ncbi:MAG: hypothetical protein V1911_01355, partial [Candidatus Micrarchaeota archaeon]
GKSLIMPPVFGFALFFCLQAYGMYLQTGAVSLAGFAAPALYVDAQFLLSIIIFITGVVLIRKS